MLHGNRTASWINVSDGSRPIGAAPLAPHPSPTHKDEAARMTYIGIGVHVLAVIYFVVHAIRGRPAGERATHSASIQPASRARARSSGVSISRPSSGA